MQQRVMWAFAFKSNRSSLSQNHHSRPSKSLIEWITAYSTFTKNMAISPKPNGENYVLAEYLVGSLNFSKDEALSISRKFSHCKYLEKTKQVVHFLRGSGFSDAHIQSTVHCLPRILFADIERTLKPKIMYFQDLGLSRPDLGSFVSRRPYILNCSLERSLKPTIGLVRNVFASDGRNRSAEMVNDDLFRTITRCPRLVLAKHTLEPNIAYLKSCGIVGTQLSSLLYRLPRIFTTPQDKLADLVSRALDMNFSMGSGMLVHAIHALSCMSIETLNSKFEALREAGFSHEEVDSMFRKSPYVFGLSGANLRSKVELLKNLKMDTSAVVRYPVILSLNIEQRVIPRYKVLVILKSRGVLKKIPSPGRPMLMSESRFLERYVLPFKTDAPQILLAYNSHFLNE